MKFRFGLTGTVVAAFVVLLAGGYLVQERQTTSSFDRLEAHQVADDSQRVRVSLEYERQLIQNYGATNSIWDNSYNDVDQSDESSFAGDFSPSSIQSLYGIDGVLGVGLDGTLRVGGLATGGDDFSAAPAQLNQPALLKTLFDPTVDAGFAKCGIVNADHAYLFCGFPTYKGDSSGPVVGGLIYLKTLDTAGLNKLSDRSGLSILTNQKVTGKPSSVSTVQSAFGSLKVSTYSISAKQIALVVDVPQSNGGSLTLQVVRDRPIHQQALKTTQQLLVFIIALGACLLFVVLFVQRTVVLKRVRALRRTVDEIALHNDHSLRIGMPSSDEIGRLAESIDRMLETIETQQAAIAASDSERAQARAKAEELVRSTAGNVLGGLDQVESGFTQVSDASQGIDREVASAAHMTNEVAGRAAQAGEVVRALESSSHQIGKMTELIAKIAGQTNLLALNATIEAARAGEAGKGFAVVAGEVKNLASMTSDATAGINQVVAAIRNDTSAVAEMMSTVTTAIDGINMATLTIADATGEQMAAVEELSRQLRAAKAQIEVLAQGKRVATTDRFGASVV